jgi:peptide/nickel transport system permease protein
MGGVGYILRRGLAGLVTLALVATFVFGAVRLLPGDAALLRLVNSGTVAKQQEQAIRKDLGLDKSGIQQFGIWVSKTLRFDFGKSFVTGAPAIDGLRRGLPVTLELVIIAWAISVIFGVSLGVLSAVMRGGPIDYGARLVGIVGLSIPDFLAATFFILAASLWFHWSAPPGFKGFFTSPSTNLQQIVPAAVLLGFTLSAPVMRLTRSALLEVNRQDYVRTARAKGLSSRVVLFRHSLRNGMIPVVTISGSQIGRLLGGTVILETVFGLPGVGSWIVNGLTLRDYPVVQLGALFVATVVIVMNLMVDIVVRKLDPRVQF